MKTINKFQKKFACLTVWRLRCSQFVVTLLTLLQTVLFVTCHITVCWKLDDLNQRWINYFAFEQQVFLFFFFCYRRNLTTSGWSYATGWANPLLGKWLTHPYTWRETIIKSKLKINDELIRIKKNPQSVEYSFILLNFHLSRVPIHYISHHYPIFFFFFQKFAGFGIN